ncbi:MAG TPA: fused response regulator/phosphatase [Spirochaetota bacterium]|nr:fused response regulator/phosphatase [Spirochaetota bacterium]HOM38306.1 fused response regulator/phosphatase [Spirochaetota bacterium]HPQ48476.1 fused response regulator/phosphatase [Spirochaetota bacterium]
MNSKPTVLVIDDYKIIIALVEKLLGKDFNLISAMTAKEGLKLIEEKLPDLILLDVDIPDMSGFEIIKIIKEKPFIKDIPVIFLTGRTKAEDIISGFELGAVDYINKPFNLKELRLRVDTHIKLKKYQDMLKKRALEIEKEIKMAKTIQAKIMPLTPPNKKISFLYKPMYLIGGDFFDIIEISENIYGIFISDVSGHGVPAALITSMLKSLIKECKELNNPSALLKYINDRMLELAAGNFITAFYGIFDFNNKVVTFSNAGHPAPFIIKDDVDIVNINKKGLPLGIYSNITLSTLGKEYVNTSIKIDSKVLLYTDGLIETISETGEYFESIMPEVLKKAKDLTTKDMISHIYNSLINFRKNDEFDDDICMIVVDLS